MELTLVSKMAKQCSHGQSSVGLLSSDLELQDAISEFIAVHNQNPNLRLDQESRPDTGFDRPFRSSTLAAHGPGSYARNQGTD
jgi:hypothetical protein